MARRIKLTRLEQERNFVPNIGNGFRLIIQASDASLMPDEIFLFQRTLIHPATATYDDELIAVCSPVDLSTYPADEPALGQTPAFFRKARVDITVPSQQDAEKYWNEIYQQVLQLKSSLDVMDVMVERQTIWIGDEPDSDGSDGP